MHKKSYQDSKQDTRFPQLDPLADRDGSTYRLNCFLTTGFFAYNGSKDLVLFKVRMHSSEDELHAFLKQHLGGVPFPTLMGEYDGHVTFGMFKAAEKRGLVTIEKAVI